MHGGRRVSMRARRQRPITHILSRYQMKCTFLLTLRFCPNFRKVNDTLTAVAVSPSKATQRRVKERGRRPELNASDSHWFDAFTVMWRGRTPLACDSGRTVGWWTQRFTGVLFMHCALIGPCPSFVPASAHGNWAFTTGERRNRLRGLRTLQWPVNYHFIHTMEEGHRQLDNKSTYVSWLLRTVKSIIWWTQRDQWH